MIYTEFAVLDTDELISYALTRTNLTNLEVELVQRLQIAADILDELEGLPEGLPEGYEAGTDYGNDSRSKGKKLC